MAHTQRERRRVASRKLIVSSGAGIDRPARRVPSARHHAASKVPLIEGIWVRPATGTPRPIDYAGALPAAPETGPGRGRVPVQRSKSVISLVGALSPILVNDVRRDGRKVVTGGFVGKAVVRTRTRA